MIALVSSYMGGPTSGGSKAAVDMLIAALLTDIPVTVITSTGRHSSLPAQIDGQVLATPRWITLPRLLPQKRGHVSPRLIAGWFLSAVRDPGWKRRLQELETSDLTIVYGFNQPLMDRVCQINSSLERKTAMVVQGSPKPETFPRKGYGIAEAVETMERYDYLIFASSRCQQDWLSFPSLAGKPSFYIPNCCQEEIVSHLMAQQRAQVRKRLRLPQDRLLAVCVGSVQYRKGQDLLLGSFADLLKAVPNLLLCLIGPVHSPWAQSLRRQIATSPFSDRLRMLGTRSNAMHYTYAADLLVLPSRAEAMPLTILEAMALKTPVIASDVDGIPELIEHGESGLLFSHERPDSLVDAFEHFANNPDLRHTFAERAHQKYWSEFSQAHQIRRCHKAFQDMMHNG